MPDLRFDGRAISVPAGTNLVEAGLAAGVPVPVFCYQRDLGAVGACRVCAVTATVKDRSRLVMACMTAAEDGMDVTTLDPGSVEFRRSVLEWLMINHPHDCPICDEGGECQLQDLTIAAGQSRRRYQGRKRTFTNQHLGEFIAHEMNRCITCYRCTRFYQDYAGGRDFAASGSRDRVYFGRFEEGPLESPFSGNLVEFCPTGVFTDKLFRYRSRVWDLDVAASVCPHCSVGCNVRPGVRYRELQRVRVRENPEVNGVFLCDRGQFGHGWVRDPARPRMPTLRGERVDWETALGTIGGRLLAIAKAHGPESVALLSSSRAPLEAHFALRALADGPLAGARISHFDDPERETRALASLGALAKFAAAGGLPLDQADIAGCDALLIAGASLVDEAPLAALAARQVARGGGRVFVVGPIERYLCDVAEVVAVHPATLGDALRAVADGAAGSGRGSTAVLTPPDLDPARCRSIGARLREAKRIGVLLGNDMLDGPAIAAGAALAETLRTGGAETRFGFVVPGPNGFGAALLSQGATLGGILAGIEEGTVRAAVLVESDVADLCASVRAALARLELLIVADHVPPELDGAHAVLPTSVSYESDGLFVNRAGRIQAFAAAGVDAIPVTRLIEAETFPREPRLVPPGGETRPAWWVLEHLRRWTMGHPAARDLAGLREAIAGMHSLAEVRVVRPGGAGAMANLARVEPAAAEVPPFARPGPAVSMFRMDRILGSEPLSRRSAPMQKMAGAPIAAMSMDGSRAGSIHRVRIDPLRGPAARRAVELDVRTEAGVPAGIILVPRDVKWAARTDQGEAVRVEAVRVETMASREGAP